VSKQQQPNKERPRSPVEAIAAAEQTLAALEQKRAKLAERATEIAEERKRLAFSAHASFDQTASARLSDLRSEVIDAEQQVAEVDDAIKTARGRLAEAQAAQAKAQDREQALALRRATREFVEAGRRVDHALSLLAADGHALIDAHSALARLGCKFPTVDQVSALGHIALRAALMSTPWSRTVETVPPGQRSRTFRVLTEQWAANIETNNIKPRLGEQTNKPEEAA
jgi:hypothetical protein